VSDKKYRRQSSPSHNNRHQHISGSPLPATYAEDATFLLDAAFDPFLVPRHMSPLPGQWTGAAFQESGNAMRWSGIDLLTQLPSSTSSGPQWSLAWAPSLGGSISFDSGLDDSQSGMHTGCTHAPMPGTSGLIHNPPPASDWLPDGEIDSDSWFFLPNAPLSPQESPRPVARSHSQSLPCLPVLTSAQQSPDLLRICM
jgi:hypothetical protein